MSFPNNFGPFFVPNSANYMPNQQFNQFQQMVRPASTSKIIFDRVQGEEAAKAYIISPGSQAILMDNDNPVFYTKVSDNMGRIISFEVFDFYKREDAPQSVTIPEVKYATPEEVRQIVKEELENFKPAQFKPKNKEVSKNA